jgi:diaminohydroxyphosphoribosylaminopyrimidine deaminase/5-amino-6-(5-phosphoribosylamino)uracil reductase
LNSAREAGADVHGATLYSTLEPCSHTGRTGPCTAAIIAAGITCVVSAISDPDEHVAGSGFDALRAADIEVITDVLFDEVSEQLAPYLHHRRTGRPFVMLKMATTLDARTAIPNGPRWITGEDARVRVHQLRAESDAIVVGSGTIAVDDPELTVRRIVLSRSDSVHATAKVQPCEVWSGSLDTLLDSLGNQGVIQLMVEGGATIATAFHEQHLINRYVFHIAPIVSGSENAPGVFAGEEPLPLTDCHLVSAIALGADLEIVMEPIRKKVEAS